MGLRTTLYGPSVTNLCPSSTRAAKLHCFPKVLTAAPQDHTEATASAIVKTESVISSDLFGGNIGVNHGRRITQTAAYEAPCKAMPRIDTESRFLSGEDCAFF